MNREPLTLLEELMKTAPRLLEVCDEITNVANYNKEMVSLYPPLADVASFMIELIIERMTRYKDRMKANQNAIRN